MRITLRFIVNIFSVLHNVTAFETKFFLQDTSCDLTIRRFTLISKLIGVLCLKNKNKTIF